MSTQSNLSDSASHTNTTVFNQNGIPTTVNGAHRASGIGMIGLVPINRLMFGDNPLLEFFMQGAGWSLVSKTASTGIAAWILDPPTGGGQGIWVYERAFGSGVGSYDPRLGPNPNPGATWPSGTHADVGTTRNVMWVPFGGTPAETVSNIAGALQGVAQYPGDGNGSTSYKVLFPLDKYSDTEANERLITVGGFLVTGENLITAGKIYQSQVLRGSNFQVAFSIARPGVDAGIRFVAQVTLLINDQPVHRVRDYGFATMTDYTLIGDPYSLYVQPSPGSQGTEGDQFSLNQYLSLIMPDSRNALPAHQTLDPIPTVALVSQQSFNALAWQGNDQDDSILNQRPGTSWFFGNDRITGITFGLSESGVSWMGIRQGSVPLQMNDGKDLIMSANMLMSTDCTGTGSASNVGTSSGPTYFLGQAWNCVLLHRDLGSLLLPYSPDPSDGTPADSNAENEWVVLFRSTFPNAANLLIGIGNSANRFNGSNLTGLLVSLLTETGLGVGSSLGAAQFKITGTSPPFTYAISGTMPPGWSQSFDGTVVTVSGNPSPFIGNIFPLTVTATDSSFVSYALQYNLVIGTSFRITIATVSLTDAHVGVPYSYTLQASGGSSTFSAWFIDSGSFPAGLSLHTLTGVVSGTPTTPGSTSISISARDAITGEWSPASPVSIRVF